MENFLLVILISLSILCIYLIIKVRYLTIEMDKSKKFLADSFSFDEDLKVGDWVEFLEIKDNSGIPKGHDNAQIIDIVNGKYKCQTPNGYLYLCPKEKIRRNVKMHCNYNYRYLIERLWKDYMDRFLIEDKIRQENKRKKLKDD